MSKEEGEKKMFARTLGKEIEHAKSADESMEGFDIKSLPIGTKFALETQNLTYIIERRTDGWYISGHPENCPEPVKVNINGSTWGGSAIRMGYIGLDMHLEYQHPERGTITTTPIREIRPVHDTTEMVN